MNIPANLIINLNKLKTLPQNAQIAIAVVPSVLIVLLFVFLIFIPRSEEIGALEIKVSQLDKEIVSSENKIKRLDSLIVENKLLKEKLARLKDKLPEEKEVSVLLKQISEQGLRSGLDILLWKPEARRNDPQGLYVEIPVKVNVMAEYHKLGDFLSHISRLPRLVNISNLHLRVKAGEQGKGGGYISTDFTASTFASTGVKAASAAPGQ